MVGLYTETEYLYNDICEEIRLFYNADKIEIIEQNYNLKDKAGLYFFHTLNSENDGYVSKALFFKKAKKIGEYSFEFKTSESNKLGKRREIKSAVKLTFYRLLRETTGKSLPWGCLTGIRPTRMLRELEDRRGEIAAKKHMIAVSDVNKSKYALAKSIVDLQRPLIESVDNGSLDIYIGIPFCPSICHYCSFSSTKTKRGDEKQSEYLDALEYEVKALKSVIAEYDVRSIYIGGGTPTSLDMPLLNRMLKLVRENLPSTKEYTVEAGRPDTITDDVLKILKEYNVNRISINPQTLKGDTLLRIGRKHTIEQFLYAFKKTREYGFENINIDLILGLPGESVSDMRRSVKKAVDLQPESITLHTLSIKNAAKYTRDMKYSADEKTILRAVDMGRRKTKRSGYKPYYMYKQKYMKGNLENVGFALSGYECIYNIDMMEEVCSVLAFGAGSISKRVFKDENRLKRSANVKDIKTYIERVEDMVKKKKELFI